MVLLYGGVALTRVIFSQLSLSQGLTTIYATASLVPNSFSSPNY